jgi:hypothetical protein
MRRSLFLSLGAGAAIALAAVAWRSTAAQNDPPAAGKAAAPEPPLPIKNVVLFNSGVGYFQREGEVVGDAKVDLQFPASDINDLLKSLVLQDLGGGKVSTVSYDSHEPIDRILHSFAIDLNNNPTFAQILNQARGERIEMQLVTSEKGIPAKVNGVIVGMETKPVAGKDGHAIPKDMINVLANEGLQSIPVEQIVGVKFMNPSLENDFQRALKILAGSHDMDKKSVSVHFTGKGNRAVRVGYVVERPIWKTTYRLRVEPNGKISMQGWAIVENTSDDDWKDVRMVLVSGRPISFKMNLYEPLFNPRPTVEPEQFSQLRPVVYGGAMNPGQPGINAGAIGGGALGGALGGGTPPGLTPGGQAMPNWQLQNGANQIGQIGQFGQAGGQIGNTFQNSVILNNRNFDANNRITFEELQNRKKQLDEAKKDAKERGSVIAMNFKEGIDSVASGDEVGDYFQYLIDQRISLSRQKSAMLPIIDQSIEGAKVSIFNETVQPKHPLLGLRLKNTSGQPLTQGPITVYDNSTYAGDTRILDLQPGEERLLSYALDQGTEVKTNVKSSPSPEMTFKIGTDSMSATYKERQAKTYTIKNRSTHDRVVIVEHPIRAGWKLVEPAKPAEQTRSVYRFEVKVPAGGVEKLTVTEDEPRVDQVALKGGHPEYVAATGITVKEVVTQHEETLQGLKVVKGIVTPTLKAKETRTRYVQNLSDTDREFHIDHVVRKDWTLLPPNAKPVAGPSVYRTTVKVEKGKAGEQAMTEERVYQDKPRPVSELADAKIREYLNNPNVSDAVKAGLTKERELFHRSADSAKALADLQRQFKAAGDDQARLRQNLSVIPQSSEPYKKFLDKFVSQEAEIETLQRQIRTAETAHAAAVRDYDAFLIAWTAE